MNDPIKPTKVIVNGKEVEPVPKVKLHELIDRSEIEHLILLKQKQLKTQAQ